VGCSVPVPYLFGHHPGRQPHQQHRQARGGLHHATSVGPLRWSINNHCAPTVCIQGGPHPMCPLLLYREVEVDVTVDVPGKSLGTFQYVIRHRVASLYRIGNRFEQSCCLE
jgi:hypothetical protein